MKRFFLSTMPKRAVETLRPAALVATTPIASRYQFEGSSVLAFGRPINRNGMVFGNTFIAARTSKILHNSKRSYSTDTSIEERMSNEVGFIGFKLIRQQMQISNNETRSVLFSDADKFMVNSVRNRDWVMAFSQIYRNANPEEIEHFFDFISRLRAGNNWNDKITFGVIRLFAEYSDRCNILEAVQKMYYTKFKIEESAVEQFIEGWINYQPRSYFQKRFLDNSASTSIER